MVRRLRSGPGGVLGGADAVGSGACGAAVGEVEAGVTVGPAVGLAVGLGATGEALPGAGAGRLLAEGVAGGAAVVVVPGPRVARTTTVATIPVSTSADTTPIAKSHPRPRPGAGPGPVPRPGVAQ
ncbi:hypothetical protein GCM10022197_33910 [Microlunatus spumicola]|uniref:Uncharacterized protein n=1 Tax=Microlunatus spumicola TaxID=81499 RepID=A0ABP6XZG7_9ACTN